MHVHLIRGYGGELCRGCGAVIEIVNLIEIDRAAHDRVIQILAPIRVLAPLEDGLLADHELGKRVGARADRPFGEIGTIFLERPMNDRRRVIVEILGHRQDRLGKIQTHGVVVHLLDGTFAHLLTHLGLTVVILFAGVVFLGHRREQALIGGTGLRVEPAGEVEDHIVRVEVVAIVPLDPLAQIKGPGGEVVGGLPAFGQIRPGYVVRSGIRQKLADMTGDVGFFDPVEGCGVAHFLDRDGAAQRAAHLGFGILRQSGLNHAVAQDLAGHAVSSARTHTEQRRRTQKFTSVDFSLFKLFDQFWDVRMCFALRLACRHLDVSLMSCLIRTESTEPQGP